MATQRKCFVLSPIGAAGSDVRAHADDVFEYIIKPAIEEMGYMAHRGDHNNRPGRISDQMYESILKDDLLIAILTYQNPNVYYELAIAHSAARPLIILCESSHNLPFDIKDHRVIFYDLRPRSLFEGVYKDEIKKAVVQLESGEAPIEVPFRPNLSPLGGLGESFRVYGRFVDAVAAGMTPTKLIAQSARQLRFSGIALQSLGLAAEFQPALAAAAKNLSNISVLIMDENNPALPSMLNSMLPDHIGKVQEEIRRSFVWWSELGRIIPNLRVRKIRRGLPYQQTIMNEKMMLYTPYSISESTHYSSTIQADKNSPLFQAQQREFDYLWKVNGDVVRSSPRLARKPLRQ